MRTGYKQANAFLSVSTPLGADELLLDTFQGTEAISQLFRFNLSMRAMDAQLDASKIVGAAVTVTLNQAGTPQRYFNGIISRFTHAGGDGEFAAYSAELVPKLWLLTLTRDRIIHQNKTAADIIKAVLDEFGVTYEAKLTGTYTSREYCVQYDESAFDFISRLMEEEGIFYFFTFRDGGHTMVLADAASAHTACTDAAALRYFPGVANQHMLDIVTSLEYESRLGPLQYFADDYSFLTPSTALLSDVSSTAGKGKQYRYPGHHAVLADGKQRATVRQQARDVDNVTARGRSWCFSLAAGTKFTLSDHPRAALNDSHVLRVVSHAASDDGAYSNSFETFPATLPFRPLAVTPWPSVSGSQTAVVVGPSGEEIWTDKHGRIKIQFHWDRLGKKDENSSCWVRVSQTWAGQGWGALFIPRIGQEVVVSHVDGDPDRPLVTGCVYNAEQTTPITLPGSQTQSTIRSRSTKKGKAGNEMRMEDKIDSEEFYFHAQKDMKVEVENDLSTKVIAGNETHSVEKGDRTVSVKTGKEVHTVKGTRSLTVTGNETHTDEANFTHTVKGNYELKVSGNLTIDVSGTVSIKSGTSFTNKAGTAMTNEAGTSMKNKASATMDNEAAIVNVKASATGTIDGGGMLTVKGGLVKIN